ncbi:MAG: epoxyqueuosine reductase [Desulfobacterium sp.]|nr:epoxyqueuosine reductase [Desulfobacterium sp.]
MNMAGNDRVKGENIIAQARGFGADIAGIARVADLKDSPSHWFSEIMPDFEGVGTHPSDRKKRGIVQWPKGAKSAIVIGVGHPRSQPEIDWWIDSSGKGNTPGNQRLMDVIGKLADWLEHKTDIRCFKLPYNIEKGGIYLKDAAVLAGLGCIGMNNLVITPQYGPRQRIRVMLVNAELPSTGSMDFDPCTGCEMPCHKVCPQQAFNHPVYSQAAYGRETLPGRTGVYDRFRCNEQMLIDEANVEAMDSDKKEGVVQRVKYCRRCEMACPVGNGS